MAVETMGWVYAMHRSTAIPVFVSSENSLQIDIPLQNTSLAKHRTKETKCTMITYRFIMGNLGLQECTGLGTSYNNYMAVNVKYR